MRKRTLERPVSEMQSDAWSFFAINLGDKQKQFHLNRFSFDQFQYTMRMELSKLHQPVQNSDWLKLNVWLYLDGLR